MILISRIAAQEAARYRRIKIQLASGPFDALGISERTLANIDSQCYS
jgi:hypothetical protein